MLVMDYFGIILVIADFGSDLTVGISLFETCHYVWAALSMFFTALPSILVLLFVIIICIFPNLFGHYLDNFLPDQMIWSKSAPDQIKIIWSKNGFYSI